MIRSHVWTGRQAPWRRKRDERTENTILLGVGDVKFKSERWDREREYGSSTYIVVEFPIFVGEYNREKDGSESLVFWRYEPLEGAERDKFIEEMSKQRPAGFAIQDCIRKRVEFGDLPASVQEEARQLYRDWRKRYGYLVKGYDWLTS